MIEEFGTLKFGVTGERLRANLAGPPYVEWRWSFVAGCGSRIGLCIVCIDLLRSLIAVALGRSRTSSIETLGGISSKLGPLSRVGEVDGVEP